MNFDFDEGKNVQYKFAMRFARENTGHDGQKLTLE